ncbi:hypothetical protein [Klebsiella pneumoniae]|uniref:hypothetical protein n=1 Tax=Klebsiella pneumoniae TaxID=573 RepID=UPI0010DBACB5|nr:hypothetical protein [Klebsiella pneumoniae]VGD57671.1 Uncharacterised protein [Klebsiella pneumoniae]
MTKSTITRERIQQIFLGNRPEPSASEERELARMALAAMDSSESVELPLDYLQGHKDGLEWAARLAEANHPDTGDWLYDDPIELAKAIRKGPDMPPSQPVADSEPVIVVGDDGGDALSYRRLIQSFEPGTKLYRHAQPAPVVPDGLNHETADLVLRFASALADKLHKAEQKYGRSTDWMKDDWYAHCLQSLLEHIEKGDPRDVAAYCAFMWHHGWKTKVAQPVQDEQKSISDQQAILALEGAGAVTPVGLAYKAELNACRAAMLSGGKP